MRMHVRIVLNGALAARAYDSFCRFLTHTYQHTHWLLAKYACPDQIGGIHVHGLLLICTCLIYLDFYSSVDFPLIFNFIFWWIFTCYFENIKESGTNSAT